ACLRKEQPWQALSGIEPHQPAVQQTRGGRRELWLAGLRPTAPGFELEALRNARKRREETVQFAADVLPLARREGRDRDTLHLAHSPHVSTFGCPGPRPKKPKSASSAGPGTGCGDGVEQQSGDDNRAIRSTRSTENSSMLPVIFDGAPGPHRD